MSTLLRSLCNISRNFARLSGSGLKTVFVHNVRSNSNLASVIKSHNKNKKQSVDAMKWILLMMPVTSFGLGCWQLYRLQWKLDLIDKLKTKVNAAPINIPTDFDKLQELEYRPVKVRGVFLHEKEICIGPRALIDAEDTRSRPGSLTSDPKKNQGWLVITPFKLEETGKEILINRGWVPQKLRDKEKRQSSLITTPVELIGVVRLTEKRPPFMLKNTPESGSWYYRDLEQMGEHLGCESVWLDARGIPDPPPGWPIPNQTRITLRNEHLSYVITWWGLSAFTGVMWHRYFIRKLPLL